MSQRSRAVSPWILLAILLPAGIVAGMWISIALTSVDPGDSRPPIDIEVVEGEVTAVLEQGEILLGVHLQVYQVVEVEILEGEERGRTVEIERGRNQLLNDPRGLREGDRLLISFGPGPGGERVPSLWDVVRTRPLALLLGVFIGATLLVSGTKGARRLLGLGLSLAVILGFILPRFWPEATPCLSSSPDLRLSSPPPFTWFTAGM